MTTALAAALAAAKRLGFYHETTTNQHAKMVGAELANQLQAVSEAIETLDFFDDGLVELGAIPMGGDHNTIPELIRDARAGLANVMELARQLRGGR